MVQEFTITDQGTEASLSVGDTEASLSEFKEREMLWNQVIHFYFNGSEFVEK